MMDEKVNVSINEIDNGFIFRRSWHEGKGEKCEYCEEEYFVKELPGQLNNLFKKGYMKDHGGNVWDKVKGAKLGEDDEGAEDTDKE